ncbi:hypothetical protein TorRG33x02_151360 [Trema orientale]|uniref:Uncharacterized protein n=1 Tax=Trema orientale TaxID=63057 RepID=A0A2P5EU37_TREOI|nr:hypothetical protein TorRG33x02_151360 [Trema orientale]
MLHQEKLFPYYRKGVQETQKTETNRKTDYINIVKSSQFQFQQYLLSNKKKKSTISIWLTLQAISIFRNLFAPYFYASHSTVSSLRDLSELQ